MQDNANKKFEPNRLLIQQHLKFITAGMTGEFDDGYIEIAYGDSENNLNQARKFSLSDVESAVDFAVEKNRQGRNIYTMGAVLSPDAAVDKRSADEDFYGCNAIWCDIDDAPDLATLKKKYAECPPSLVIVTGRHPKLRIHLWWKLDEAITNRDEIRNLVKGVQESLGGDPKTTNECRLMRIGGSVAWPTKKKQGRITEMTEVQLPANANQQVNGERVRRVFPPSSGQPQSIDVIKHDETKHGATAPKYHSTVAGLAPERITDDRDRFMSDMAFASIINLAGELKRWPTAQEVYDDVWPVYSSKAALRAGEQSLDSVGRGGKELQSKIRSKLGRFRNGHMKYQGQLVTIDYCVKQFLSRAQSQPAQNAPRETIIETQARAQFRLLDWIASTKYAGEAPPIKWLVEGLFPLGVPMLLAAMGGLGKSFIALDMAIKIAMPPSTLGERKVLGHSVKQHGRVVLLTAEDSFDSIHRRVNKLAPADVLQQTKDNLIIIPMSSVDISQLLVREGRNGLEMTEVFQDIKAQLLQIPDIKLVAIDPLQAFVGADITSKPEAAQFMWSAFAKIAAQTGASFLATHHMRKDGTADIKTAADARESIRGTTGLVDGARVAYVLWQVVKEIGEAIATAIDQPYESHRYIQGAVVKANDEADHAVMSFYREESGVLTCHGVVDTSSAARKAGILTENQDFIYRAILDAMLGSATRSITPYQGQQPVKAITYEQFYSQLERMGYKQFVARTEEDLDPDKLAMKIKNTTTSIRLKLKTKGKIDFNKEYIWIPKDEAKRVLAESPVELVRGLNEF